RQPVTILWPVRHEMRVEELGARVVCEWRAVELTHRTSGGREHGVGGRGVPLARGTQARVDVRRPLREQAELQRAADGHELVRAGAGEKGVERVTPVGAA